MEKLRISTSEVIGLSLSPQERMAFFDEERQAKKLLDSREGRQIHKNIQGEMARKNQATLFSSTPDPVQTVTPEYRVNTIHEGVSIVGVIDVLLGSNKCIEAKPTLKGRHVFQLMLNCMLFYFKSGGVNPIGVLHCYRKSGEKNYVLPNGGVSKWEAGLEACILAARIIGEQKKIDQQKAIINSVGRKKQTRVREYDYIMPWTADLVVEENIVSDRKRFDEITQEIVEWVEQRNFLYPL